MLPPAIAQAVAAWQALVLVKPQFEAGRADAPKGVVRDPEVHRRVLREFCATATGWRARVAGVVDSGHPGPKGNREFVVHLIASEEPSDPDERERRIRRRRRLSGVACAGSRSSRTAGPARSATAWSGSSRSRRRSGVELLVAEDEAARHGIAAHGDPGEAELVVVLGGDGTMLRALRTFLGTGSPCSASTSGGSGSSARSSRRSSRTGCGGRSPASCRSSSCRRSRSQNGGSAHVAVNDVVVTSGEIGRMVELEWAVGGEDLGRVPCDGLICSTPSGSTAYNLSNGGPVLMWGIDALATTFVAPHSLHARPLVVPRAKDVVVWNRTPDVPVVVLVDGHRVGEAGRDESVTIRLGDARTLLASLPGATFVSRYRDELLDLARRGQVWRTGRRSTITACFADCGSRTSS